MISALFATECAPAFVDMCPTHISGEELQPYDHVVPLWLTGDTKILGLPADSCTPIHVTADYSKFLWRRHQKRVSQDEAARQAIARAVMRREEEAA